MEEELVGHSAFDPDNIQPIDVDVALPSSNRFHSISDSISFPLGASIVDPCYFTTIVFYPIKENH